MNNMEDDPNATPASVTRSPLGLGMKDADLLTSVSNNTSSSNTISNMPGPISLTFTNTWSYNPNSEPSARYVVKFHNNHCINYTFLNLKKLHEKYIR